MAQEGHTGKRPPPQQLPRWSRWLITITFIAASAALIWAILPKGGFDTDLSRIGEGRPIAVLVYETAHPTAIDVMEQLAPLRGAAPGDMDFLVANTGTPEGSRFAQQYRTSIPGTLVLFDAAGEHRETLRPPQSTEEIRRAAQHLADSRGRGY